MEAAVLVGAGGAVGATLRYLVSIAVPSEWFPFATLTVNVLGSFALAALVFAGASDDLSLLFGVGVCGSFTTYSSFSVETVRLWEVDGPVWAGLYAVGTFLACALAAGVAWVLVAALA